MRHQYDYTKQAWIKRDSGAVPVSVATADQWQPKSTQASEGNPTRLSLAEWLIIGPMMIGLGFLIGVYWP